MATGEWVILGAVAVAVSVAAVWVWQRRPDPDGDRPPAGVRDDAIGAVVIDALASEWSTRFACTENEMRAMVRSGVNPALRRRIEAGVGMVDVKFDATGPDRTSVTTTVIVNYAGDGARSTAEMSLPWGAVPAEVRAELLRSGRSTVFRKWRAAAGGQAAADPVRGERSVG